MQISRAMLGMPQWHIGLRAFLLLTVGGAQVQLIPRWSGVQMEWSNCLMLPAGEELGKLQSHFIFCDEFLLQQLYDSNNNETIEILDKHLPNYRDRLQQWQVGRRLAA